MCVCVCERTNFYCFHYFYTRQKYITLNEIQLIALLVKEVSFSLKLLYTGFFVAFSANFLVKIFVLLFYPAAYHQERYVFMEGAHYCWPLKLNELGI